MKKLSNINYKTKNLRLVPYRPEDINDIYKLFLDKKLMHFIPDEIPPREQIERLIDKMVNFYYPETEKGDICLFTLSVVENKTGKIIGWCGINDFDLVPDKSEIFCALSSKYWGRGYGGEIVEALLDITFRILGLTEISAAVHPDNTASLRIVSRYAKCLGTVSEVFGMDGENELYFKINKNCST